MFLSPQEILRHVVIPSSSRVADFGTGKGYFGLEIARRLGTEATVYVFDPYTPSLEAVRREAKKMHAPLYALLADLNLHIPVRANLFTHAIVANTLYQLRDRARFVQELSRVVEPGGVVLVADWLGSFNNMGPMREEVLSPSDAVQLFADAGFETSGMLPAGTHHFAFRATCRTH